MNTELKKRIETLEEKQAIEELTHSYLAAADKRDNIEMANHFTKNGSLTSIMSDATIVLKKRQGIADGFARILAHITTAHHMTGQLRITLNNEEVTGISYCYVTLVGTEDGQKYVRKISAVYKDEYAYENRKWLINTRIATVSWDERNNL